MPFANVVLLGILSALKHPQRQAHDAVELFHLSTQSKRDLRVAHRELRNVAKLERLVDVSLRRQAAHYMQVVQRHAQPWLLVVCLAVFDAAAVGADLADIARGRLQQGARRWPPCPCAELTIQVLIANRTTATADDQGRLRIGGNGLHLVNPRVLGRYDLDVGLGIRPVALPLDLIDAAAMAMA
ncbi:hypothetical protein D3C72_1187050 [compost metagenome]